MSPKFVKPILVDNGNDLLTAMAYNFDISIEKVDCGFNKSRSPMSANVYSMVPRSHNKIFKFHWIPSRSSEDMKNL